MAENGNTSYQSFHKLWHPKNLTSLSTIYEPALGDTEAHRTRIWLQKSQQAEVETGGRKKANVTSSLDRWKRGCPLPADTSPMSPRVGVAQGDPRSFLEG